MGGWGVGVQGEGRRMDERRGTIGCGVGRL